MKARMNGMRISTRLIIGFGMLAAMLFAVVVVSLLGIRSMSSASTRLEHMNALQQKIGLVRFDAADLNGWQTGYAFDVANGKRSATSDKVGSRKEFLVAADRYRKAVRELKAEQLTKRERYDIGQAQVHFNNFMSIDKRIIALYRQNTPAADRQADRLVLVQEIVQFSEMSKHLDLVATSVNKRSHAAALDAESAKRSALVTLLALALGALGFAVALIIGVTRSIARPLNGLTEAADRLAEGRIRHESLLQIEQDVATTDVGSGFELHKMARSFDHMVRYVRSMAETGEAISKGDISVAHQALSEEDVLGVAFENMVGYLGEVANIASAVAQGDLTHDVVAKSEKDILSMALYEMTESLRRLLGELSDTALNLNSASQQMESTSREVGRGMEEIAISIGELAAGAEKQVRSLEVARNDAERAAEDAEGTRAMTDEGMAAVTQASQAMYSLAESSREVSEAIHDLASKSDQIGGIVDAITEIAEQTNLLALNAAVEAARAGEQGRGFAVVADEVRKLAAESRAAAASIAGIVTQIQKETGRSVKVVEEAVERTKAGSEVVETAQGSFMRISDSVVGVSAGVEQIRNAAVDVAAVASQASASTEEVSAATEQTTASMQEIAASSRTLAAMAEDLTLITARFKLNQDGSVTSMRRAA